MLVVGAPAGVMRPPSMRPLGAEPGAALPECRRGVQGPEPAGLVDGMSADDMMPSAAQVQAASGQRATHPREPHTGGSAGRLNRLRAAVLGANDGIVSVAGIVIGVAGATTNRGPIFTAGLAG